MRLPVGTLGEMSRFQTAVVNEGLDAHDKYWRVFLPALAISFQIADMPREVQAVIQEFLNWSTLLN